jgi:hypothetical protein
VLRAAGQLGNAVSQPPGWFGNQQAFRRAAISFRADRAAQLASPRHQISGCAVHEIKLGDERPMSSLFAVAGLLAARAGGARANSTSTAS